MTSPIQQNNATPYIPSRLSSTGLQKQYQSYSEAMSQRSAANISFTTAEGDVVTISNYQEQAYSLASEKWATPLQQGMTFTASVLNVDASSLSVQGDLNEEELADIQNLMVDLTSIAEEFFNGNLGEAMDQAMNIGDMGSISQLSASFSYQASWSASSQITDYHPVPAAEDGGDSLVDIFAVLPEVVEQAHTDEMKYAEMLQAQWKQIKEFLEAKTADPASTTTDSAVAQETAPVVTTNSTITQDNENIPAARKMMNRMRKTVARHPRLAPFGLSLAHEAIDNKSEGIRPPAQFSQKNMLKDNFLQEFTDWMYAV
ncbi:MAG: hypothetical protein KKC76_02260 [Proteobacteria bacterium]|nr:hypothetical protein [Pseudomonadota bacterium]MBU4298226.1 hypothetical protein [Pseudomonadota bacterium]MCG2747494.1 hypothetical protein [Desulfobulbaceae bacterium]